MSQNFKSGIWRIMQFTGLVDSHPSLRSLSRAYGEVYERFEVANMLDLPRSDLAMITYKAEKIVKQINQLADWFPFEGPAPLDILKLCSLRSQAISLALDSDDIYLVALVNTVRVRHRDACLDYDLQQAARIRVRGPAGNAPAGGAGRRVDEEQVAENERQAQGNQPNPQQGGQVQQQNQNVAQQDGANG